MPINISGININGISIYDSTGLYNFTSFTFLTGNVVGATGPTAAQLFANSYSNVSNTWLQTTSFYNTYGNGYQFWTVPANGNYQIIAAGARSGFPSYSTNLAAGNATVGNGAIVQGTFSLTQGQILTLVVGQPSGNSGNNPFSSTGGGGASWVVTSTNSPLIVAGGGGGGGNYNSGTPTSVKGGNAVTSTTGGTSNKGAPGGINGIGGNSHVAANGVVSQNAYDSGGGGGMYANGVVGTGGNARGTVSGAQSGGGGAAFIYGAKGGDASTSYLTFASQGGFGGGGGAGPITGGGGGGYSGGGGAWTSLSTQTDGGGGGGSYIDSTATNVATSDGNYNASNTFNGSSITNLNSYNYATGYIIITKV